MINWSNFNGFFSAGVPAEIMFSSLVISVFLILFFIASKRAQDKEKCILWVLLVEYVFIVVCSTIICRGVQSFEIDRLQLTPFWTYVAIIKHIKGVSVWDIILNVVLFIPLGFLLKLIYKDIKLWRIFLIAMIGSIFIESSQFIFKKGLSQFDDVMLILWVP